MQRITVRRISALQALQRYACHYNVPKRYLATVKEVFPHKTDFPSRHIGPRKTEVVAMLDYIGYKVGCLFCVTFFLQETSNQFGKFI